MSSDRRSDHHLIVILDAPGRGPPSPAGVLTRWAGPVLAVVFQYAATWLRAEHRFPIDPRLPLVEAVQPIPVAGCRSPRTALPLRVQPAA